MPHDLALMRFDNLGQYIIFTHSTYIIVCMYMYIYTSIYTMHAIANT